MKLSETNINEFINSLGSSSPVPGGGGSCALSGAQGVALITMVANLTVGKPKFSQYEELNQFAIEEGNKLCMQLVDLVDKDAEAFGGLAKAYKLPRESDKDRLARNKAIAEATLKATESPFEMMEIALKALYLCKSLIGKSNKNVSSDLGVSALSLLSCIKGAWLNVLINLPGIENAADAEYYRAKGNEILDAAESEAEFIYTAVKEML